MKKILSIISVSFCSLFFGQLLITEKTPAGTAFQGPHPSAMLEVRSNSKGVLIPLTALSDIHDQTTVQAPVEGTIIYNTSVADPGNNDIPVSRPALTVWDGSQWLFAFNKTDVELDLDKVSNFIADNGSTVLTLTNFLANQDFAYGSNIDSNWSVLIDSQQAFFEFSPANAEQRMVIDVEGLAAVNNNVDGSKFAYAVGVFVNNKLVSAQKFHVASFGGACAFNKFNIRAILDEGEDSIILNQAANTTYNVKVAVRTLPKPNGGVSYERIVFGNDAGNRSGTNTPCGNLNSGTARSYMNILTIERKHIN